MVGVPDGVASYSADAIYNYLAHHRFDDGLVAKPLSLARSETITLDRRAKHDGVIGVVRTEVRGLASDASISFVVYRDRAVAEAARDREAVFESKAFLAKPGELISPHAFSYHERGEARCLSRQLVGATSTATVTCYLLVQYPARDPVMIESELSEYVPSTHQEASAAAVARADDLLLVGIKEWVKVYPHIGRD